MPNVMVFEGGAYRRCLVHEDGILMNKIHDHVKETPQRPLTPSTMISLWSGRGSSPDHDGIPMSVFWAPEKNKCLCFKLLSLWYIVMAARMH